MPSCIRLLFIFLGFAAHADLKGEYRVSDCRITYATAADRKADPVAIGLWGENSLNCKFQFFDGKAKKPQEWHDDIVNAPGSYGLTSCLLDVSSENEQGKLAQHATWILSQPLVLRDVTIASPFPNDTTFVQNSVYAKLLQYCRNNSAKYRVLCVRKYGAGEGCEPFATDKTPPSPATGAPATP